MSTIASAADVTAPALYRHYTGKAQLLAAVLDRGTGLVERALDEIDHAAGNDHARPATLDAVTTTLADLGTGYRQYGVIIQRDTRSLPPDDRDHMRRRWRRLNERLASIVRAARPECGSREAELTARAMFAVAASPSYFSTARALGSQRRDLLAAALTVVARHQLLPAPPVPTPARPLSALRDRASRREAIMSVATRLFGEQGFDHVSMEQIADAAHVTVPTVYSHFSDKADLMVTAQYRGTAWLQLAAAYALERYLQPAAALAEILESYVEFGIKHTDNMAVLAHELHNLPIKYRVQDRRGQREYVAELIRLLDICRPELDETSQRLLVHAALGVVNELTRTDRYLNRPHLQSELAALTRGICAAQRNPAAGGPPNFQRAG